MPERLGEIRVKRSTRQDSVGLINFYGRTEVEMLDDMAVLLPAFLVSDFHLESLTCILIP